MNPHLSLPFFILSFLFISPASTLSSQDDRKPRSEQRGKGGGKEKGSGPKIDKPRISDTVKANIYADNWFKLYLNGNLVAVDSISFIPHNVVSVDILPEYPMTIAVMAKDNADKDTGLEYENTNLGDGGFTLKFGDGTVSNASWKAKSYFHGPINGDLKKPQTKHEMIPDDWFSTNFDDQAWDNAVEHTEEAVGTKAPYYENDFEGAKWIWTKDLALDNTVIFRTTIPSPPNGSAIPKDWPRGKIDASEKK
jgi:hypothetical protein